MSTDKTRVEFVKRYAETVWKSSPEIRAEFKGNQDLFGSYCRCAWAGTPGAAADARIGPVTRARFVRDAWGELVRTHQAGDEAGNKHIAMVMRSAGVDFQTAATSFATR